MMRIRPVVAQPPAALGQEECPRCISPLWPLLFGAVIGQFVGPKLKK